ncbi:MAG: DNA translocase FtsK [Clostridia bacterium]|nr:DNA translocase FtsK [Clostridia bacterium]
MSLLNPPVSPRRSGTQDHSEKIEMMESTLRSFGIEAWVENITVGPAITRYELSIARGTRVSRILNLSDDIALSMAAVGVRIEAPIPGKSAIGIEIPNDTVSMVTLREVLEDDAFQKHKSPVAVGLGKDITGTAIVADLAKMPHLLIAGQTGAGKSVCINSIITSLLYKSSPKDVRLILVDPKMLELNVYNGIPQLMTPVVTDPKKAAGALQFVVREMEKRYETFAKRKVMDIYRYNEVAQENGEDTMPRIVVIVDELNDLMLVARGEVEDSVMRIAQLARAAGIYLILATQRPSVNVITGVIKANIPSRIAFAVASGVDSKTILDSTGAEKLVGKGDMLFHLNGSPKPVRVQGAFVGEQEIEKVVDAIKAMNMEAKYIAEEQLIMRELKPTHGGTGENPNDAESNEGEDELFPAAVEYAIECGNVSISALQRRFKVGYARAGRLIDDMELRGIIEPSQGAKARKVLVTREQFWAMYDERLD